MDWYNLTFRKYLTEEIYIYLSISDYHKYENIRYKVILIRNKFLKILYFLISSILKECLNFAPLKDVEEHYVNFKYLQLNLANFKNNAINTYQHLLSLADGISKV